MSNRYITVRDPTPERLRKLMTRLAQLQPGQAYTITIFLADDQSEPTWTVLLLGKLENYRQDKKSVLG